LQNLDQFRMPPHFRGKPGIYVQLWWLVDALLFKTSPQVLYAWRRWLLRLFGAKIGKKVIIRPSVRITYPWKIIIGDFSWIGDHAELYSLGKIIIGDHVVVSQKSYLCTGSHHYNTEGFDIYEKPIIIEDKVWIATDVFIGPGVKVGTGAVIGARSTVLKNVEANGVYAGNPLQKIRNR
jgi:putative colanic acid biosynthesis acetyltransferase WcaF